MNIPRYILDGIYLKMHRQMTACYVNGTMVSTYGEPTSGNVSKHDKHVATCNIVSILVDSLHVIKNDICMISSM